MESSPLTFRTPIKKRKSVPDTTDCVICQKVTDEPTRRASAQGISSFLKAFNERKVAGDCDPEAHIESCTECVSGEFRFKESVGEIYWHKGCYSSFTSKEHIGRLGDAFETDTIHGATGSKIKRESFKWKEVCLFCGQRSYKKDKTLINVATFSFCSTLEKRATEKRDAEMQRRVGSYSQLIANEARYHKTCHVRYIKQGKQLQGEDATDSVYDRALDIMVNEIQPHLKEGKAYTMKELLERYHQILQEDMPERKANSYTRHKLKVKLETKYNSILRFIPSNVRAKSDIVIDKFLKLEDVINSAARIKEALKCARVENDMTLEEGTDLSPGRILHYAACILKAVQKDCTGIETQPLDPSDISQEQEEKMVPKELYSFITLMTAFDRSPSTDMDTVRENSPVLHQKVLAICQDIVYLRSKGKCKTPKHIGLSMALHQLTQCKEVVTLINKNGHGISYDEMERIDTCWAKTQLDKNEVTVPTNMTPGVPLCAAGDNFNRATEALDGTHLDIVNMVLYQGDTNNNSGTFGSSLQTASTKHRTINDFKTCELLECPKMTGKQPGPNHLLKSVNLEWFFKCSSAHAEQRALDMVYIEARMMPMKIFEAHVHRTETQIPGWSVFHARVTEPRQLSRTKIGYCPMIPASATDPNTVYTMMKQFQRIFKTLGQEWTYVTYDEAIYSKAQMIKWRNTEEFQLDEMEMGGMHRAMNFMGDIGKVMEESGFEDIVVEANIYGPSVTQAIMKGKSYNRGVRTHKIVNESMNRLKWKAFQKWLITKNVDISENEKAQIGNDVPKLREILLDGRNQEVEESQEVVNAFIQHTAKLHDLLHDFTVDGRMISNTFEFWDNYTCDLSQLLLDYIAAKRTGNRNLELETFAEMLPLDFMCGHTNYARWGTINVVEGQVLKERKPHIHQVIANEHSAVYRTEKPFSGVWHDMAIEQTLNRDCGKFKHLYTHEAALNKYYLTAHLKTEVTENIRKIAGIFTDDNGMHKESTNDRIEKDESAIQRVITLVEERMVNPFEVKRSASEEEKIPLINIATAVVATDDVQSSVCNVREMGQKQLNDFIENRIQTNKVDFMAPISKQKLKTFASLNTPVKIKKNNKVESINTDRNIFSKLTVIAQSRDVDIRNLMRYELTPVPLALFNLDGSMRKTLKSVTLSLMEEKTVALKQLPAEENPLLLVIDLMMLLRMLCTEKTECKTFGDLSSTVIDMVLGMGYKYTAIVGDSYVKMDSIKSAERARRGSVQMQEIRNPSRETPLPRQKQKYLSNPLNKMNLADFVLTEIQNHHEKLPNGIILFLGGGFTDPKRAVQVERNSCIRVEDLESDQEEADSRMFLHIDYAVRELSVTSVVLWSMDSDVAALCPRYSLLLNIKLFFKTGIRGLKRYIPMHDVATELGEDMSMALPIMHALSGCNSTSSFCGVGKKRWMSSLQKHPDLLVGLLEIGSDPLIITDFAVETVTRLLSEIYIGKQMESIDEVRYEMFCKKSCSSEKLPPTSDALKLHVQRANYQTFIWMFATSQNLNLPSPLEAGWTENDDGTIIPRRMTKPSAPDALLDFTRCTCTRNCEDRRCGCNKERLWCTDACACDNELCQNRLECYIGGESDEND